MLGDRTLMQPFGTTTRSGAVVTDSSTSTSPPPPPPPPHPSSSSNPFGDGDRDTLNGGSPSNNRFRTPTQPNQQFSRPSINPQAMSRSSNQPPSSIRSTPSYTLPSNPCPSPLPHTSSFCPVPSPSPALTNNISQGLPVASTFTSPIRSPITLYPPPQTTPLPLSLPPLTHAAVSAMRMAYKDVVPEMRSNDLLSDSPNPLTSYSINSSTAPSTPSSNTSGSSNNSSSSGSSGGSTARTFWETWNNFGTVSNRSQPSTPSNRPQPSTPSNRSQPSTPSNRPQPFTPSNRPQPFTPNRPQPFTPSNRPQPSTDLPAVSVTPTASSPPISAQDGSNANAAIDVETLKERPPRWSFARSEEETGKDVILEIIKNQTESIADGARRVKKTFGYTSLSGQNEEEEEEEERKRKKLKKNEEENGEEFQELSFKLPLFDPITHSRIRIPARGKHCLHRTAFDLKMFLSQKPTQNGRRRCPFCQKFIQMTSIVVDGFVQNILNGTKEVVREAEVRRDGSWLAVHESSAAVSPNSIDLTSPNGNKRMSLLKRNQNQMDYEGDTDVDDDTEEDTDNDDDEDIQQFGISQSYENPFSKKFTISTFNKFTPIDLTETEDLGKQEKQQHKNKQIQITRYVEVMDDLQQQPEEEEEEEDEQHSSQSVIDVEMIDVEEQPEKVVVVPNRCTTTTNNSEMESQTHPTFIDFEFSDSLLESCFPPSPLPDLEGSRFFEEISFQFDSPSTNKQPKELVD